MPLLRIVTVSLACCLVLADSRLSAQTSASARRVGEITINESSPIKFTDDDLRTIQAMLPGDTIAWMDVSHVTNDGSPVDMLVTTCMRSTATRPELKRGRCRTFAKMHARGAQPSRWQKFGPDDNYVVFVDAAARPPLLYPQYMELSDERLLSLDRLLRRKAVTSSTPNLASEIQPWPIRELIPLETADDLRVLLATQGSWQAQSIRLRATGNDWDIVEMHALDIRPVQLFPTDGAGSPAIRTRP